MRLAGWWMAGAVALTGVARGEDIELLLETDYDLEVTLRVGDRAGFSVLTDPSPGPDGGSGTLNLGERTVKSLFDEEGEELQPSSDSALIARLGDDRLLCSTLRVEVANEEPVALRVRRDSEWSVLQAFYDNEVLPPGGELSAAVELLEPPETSDFVRYWYGCFRIARMDSGIRTARFVFEVIAP
jgi:hypothetical protein